MVARHHEQTKHKSGGPKRDDKQPFLVTKPTSTCHVSAKEESERFPGDRLLVSERMVEFRVVQLLLS